MKIISSKQTTIKIFGIGILLASMIWIPAYADTTASSDDISFIEIENLDIILQIDPASLGPDDFSYFY